MVKTASRPSIRDLPNQVFLDILLNLSPKAIIFCKCVCKAWELHLAQGKACPLVRMSLPCISRTLYFLEPEDCPNTALDSKVMIPLRNARAFLGDVGSHPVRRRKNLIQVDPRDYVYRITNSCRGLFCLVGAAKHLEAFVVCNPITGEFVHLPKPCVEEGLKLQGCGIGFSTKNDQYKVISLYNQWTVDAFSPGSLIFGGTAAEIHTLGANSWRSLTISDGGDQLKFRDSPAYLDGALHWLLVDKEPNLIASFDMSDERFQFHSFPLPSSVQGKGHHLNMGVLGGFLCVYINAFTHDHIDIWSMRETEHGVGKAWTPLLSIHFGVDRGLGRFQPISYLDNGETLLVFNPFEDELIYCDKKGGLKSKYLKVEGLDSNFEVIPFVPSFVSLKDIVAGRNVYVLNTNSRFWKDVELIEEACPLLQEAAEKRWSV